MGFFINSFLWGINVLPQSAANTITTTTCWHRWSPKPQHTTPRRGINTAYCCIVPICHIYLLLYLHLPFFLFVCHVGANNNATSCDNQGGSYRRFPPEEKESGPSIIAILSFRSNRLAVEGCSRSKEHLMERGRRSCCVHHQITAVTCRRHPN